MTWIWNLVVSPVGKKLLMALTGWGLLAFVAGHLAGNLLVFKGSNAYNTYAAALAGAPFLVPVELALLGVLVVHMVVGVILTLENRSARPEPYLVVAGKGGRGIANNNMLLTGLVSLAFIIVHVATFKYGQLGVDAQSRTDFFGKVVQVFGTLNFLTYIFAVCVVALHVSHGLGSSFRTIGVHHPRYTPGIEWLSIGFAVVVAFGFGSIPFWAHFIKGG
ncbi:MAG: succinate dehydrogenase cytochrome b subunit [Candidatus Riflebacteria bacterium]|nr:succinate dehydrogenase cytochrome b subunit [Candidatus Riflebacteria bacterium]